MNDDADVKTLVVLAANPSETPSQLLEQEVNLLVAGIGKARTRLLIEPARPQSLVIAQQYLFRMKPTIVHILGYRTSQLQFIDSDHLSPFFESIATSISCVVLNGCYAYDQFNVIKRHIKYPLGITPAIRESVGTGWICNFYKALTTPSAIDPIYIALQLDLGRLYYGLNDSPRAEQAFQMVLTLNPDNLEAQEYLEKLSQPRVQPVYLSDAASKADSSLSPIDAEAVDPALFTSITFNLAPDPSTDPATHPSSFPVPSLDPIVHQSLLAGRYQLFRQLGRGGQGQTFLARDTKQPDDPICVVKQLLITAHHTAKDVALAQRYFQQEARILEKLGSHNQIPQLLAYFEENGEFYLVQEYIFGHTLEDELIQPYSELAVIQLLVEILRILVYVHERNIIHRDIKPSNLIRRYADNQIVLIDFGAIKQITLPYGSTGTIIGTRGYCPPEQWYGKPRLASDLYAVGIIGIQAITGRSVAEIADRLDEINSAQLFKLTFPEMSNALAAVLYRMAAFSWLERFQSAAEALQALLTVEISGLDHLPGISGPSGQSSRIPANQDTARVDGYRLDMAWSRPRVLIVYPEQETVIELAEDLYRTFVTIDYDPVLLKIQRFIEQPEHLKHEVQISDYSLLLLSPTVVHPAMATVIQTIQQFQAQCLEAQPVIIPIQVSSAATALELPWSYNRWNPDHSTQGVIDQIIQRIQDGHRSRVEL